MGTSTPWGRSDYTKRTEKQGVTWFGTPSHGGFRVTPKASENFAQVALDEAIEDEDGFWFEEDCDAAIVLAEVETGWHPDWDAVAESLARWHPDYLNAKGE